MPRAVELPSDYPPAGVEVRLIQRFVDLNGRRILEIGCDDGRLTRQLAPLTSSVVAVEPDSAMVRDAQRTAAAEGLTNVSFRVGIAERIRLGGGPMWKRWLTDLLANQLLGSTGSTYFDSPRESEPK